MKTTIAMTEASQKLFRFYSKDASNWSGNPYLGGNRDFTKEDRGNLTHLKKLGLLTTTRDEFGEYITFTEDGKKLAKELFGVEIEC